MSKKNNKSKELIKNIQDHHPEFQFLIDQGHLKSSTPLQGFGFSKNKNYIILEKNGAAFIYSKDEKRQVGKKENLQQAISDTNNLEIRGSTSLYQQKQDELIDRQIENTQKANEGNKELTQGQIEATERERSLFATLKNASTDGKDVIQILREMEEKGEITPEERAFYTAKMTPGVRLKTESEIIGKGAEKRGSFLDRLNSDRDKQKHGQRAEAQLLSDPELGSPDIAKAVQAFKEKFPEYEDALTPSQMMRLATTGVLDEAIASSRPLVDIVKERAAGLPDRIPTKESVEQKFNDEYGGRGNVYYPELQPLRDKMHRLGNGGHAGGTTMSYLQSTYNKQRDVHDLDTLSKLMDVELKGWDLENKGLGAILGLADGIVKGIVNPAAARQKSFQDSLNQESQNVYNENLQDQTLAEGNIKNSLIDDQNQLTLHDRLNASDNETVQWAKSLENQVTQFEYLMNNMDVLGGEQELQLEQLRMNLWSQREGIVNMLQQSGNAQQAFELGLAKTPESFGDKIKQFAPAILTAAGTVAGAISGGPPGAAAGATLGNEVGKAIQGKDADYSKVDMGKLFPDKQPIQPQPQNQQPSSNSSGSTGDAYADSLLGRSDPEDRYWEKIRR